MEILLEIAYGFIFGTFFVVGSILFLAYELAKDPTKIEKNKNL